MNLVAAATAALCGLLLLRTVLSLKSVLYLLGRWWRWLDDRAQAYQIYRIPRQENPLHRKASLYLSSLPSLEDSDHASLFSSGRKPNDFSLHLGPAQSVSDSFLGARLTWSTTADSDGGGGGGGGGALLLRIRRQDRSRVLRPYLQHVEAVADEMEQRRREIRLFINGGSGGAAAAWRSVPFTHPATLDSVAMDPDLKGRVRSDLESFVKGKAYYARLGRVWKRSYLLHGPPGTGKSSFVAAMARFLSYDIYDLDLSRTGGDCDLRSLLLQTSPRSVILVEDLDRYLSSSSGDGDDAARLTGMLNFMDGIFSCCGEERVMVFTMGGGGGKEAVDPAVLRPGRLDVHIYFPMCDFTAFKTLASSYLGVKDHKLYPQVEEGFQSGARLSPAEVGEIMIANRGSPSRAIKTVISALNRAGAAGAGAARRQPSESGSVNSSRGVEVDGCGGAGGIGFGKDATMREFRKLYGLIKMRTGSRREGTLSLEEAAAAAKAAAAANDSGGLGKEG